jgi:hypothetical protein
VGRGLEPVGIVLPPSYVESYAVLSCAPSLPDLPLMVQVYSKLGDSDFVELCIIHGTPGRTPKNLSGEVVGRKNLFFL